MKHISKRKKSILLIISTIIFLIIIGSYVVYMNTYPIKVGKQPVHVDELMLFINKNMTGVKSKFIVSSDTSKDDFWYSSVNGEIPYEVLMKQAEQDLKESKAVQIWAVEEGILNSSSYKKFLREWKEHNKNEIPIDKRNYYFYRQDNLELMIQEKLSHSTADIEAVTEYYNQDPERTMGSVECVVENIEDGLIISSSQITIDDINYRSVSESNEELATNAFLLDKGESISWIDEYGQNIRLTCIDKEPGKIVPVSEVLETAHTRYTRHIFEEQLKKRAANIEVSKRWFSEKILSKLTQNILR